MTATAPPTIAICGKGRIATAALSYTLHYLRATGLQSDLVACPNTDDRGYDGWQESLTVAADELHVLRTTVAALEASPGLLLICLEYDRLIAVERFASRRLYNIHFSALPRYRGVFTSIWPLLNGERESGVTLHEIDRGADTGRIVAQRRFPLAEGTTARALYDMYMREGLLLFREWLPRLLREPPPAFAQDETLASSYNRKSLDLRRVELDLTKPAAEICRMVDAFHFPEYQLPLHRGRAVRAAAELHVATDLPAGSVVHETPFSSSIAAGDGQVVELIWG